ncbi:response regulator [Polycladidibacter stylochi]|uniref:response regulator n=1 Tax=Polycladidibacter stylochi TaxID=1807766 RepID=UPI00083126EC|nr:response regulator [Pseudovibrio stylochi]
MARVLLSEDDDAVRAFVKRALELDGHRVIAVEDGSEAALTLSEEEGAFDLLLSDIMMPEMDGIALAKQANSMFPQLPILLMTGYADLREGAEDVRNCVEDVLNKPFSLLEVRNAVKNALADSVPSAEGSFYA